MEHWAGPILSIVGITVGLFGIRQAGLAGVFLTATAAALLFLAAYLAV